jgi:NAD-dependent dihydropyrimidine dehydrogenase PreA subunit
MRYCPVGGVIAIDEGTGRARVVDPVICGGCYSCLKRCPNGAIKTVIVEHQGLIDYTKHDFKAPGQS